MRSWRKSVPFAFESRSSRPEGDCGLLLIEFCVFNEHKCILPLLTENVTSQGGNACLSSRLLFES